jgi:hypothetical protein
MTFKSNFQDWFPSELKLDRSALDKNNFTGVPQTHGTRTEGDRERTKFSATLTARGFDHDSLEGFEIEKREGVWSRYRNERGAWAQDAWRIRRVLQIAFPGMFKKRDDLKRLRAFVTLHQFTGWDCVKMTPQQAKAYRWLIVITGYFREGLSCSDIANEHGLTVRQVEGIVQRISNILKGRNKKHLRRNLRGKDNQIVK